MVQAAKHTTLPAELAGNVLITQWTEFCRLRNVVLDGGNRDAIHDLRVASRRLRAVLALFAPFLPGRFAKRLSRDIHSVTDALGPVRNMDEALLYFGAISTPLPGLLAGLEKTRKKGFKGVAKALKAFSCRECDNFVHSMVADLVSNLSAAGPEEVVMVHLLEMGESRYRQVKTLLTEGGAVENVEGRHKLRIAIKKWRYLLEAVGTLMGRDFGKTLEILKGYQTVLGNLNDMVVFSDLCRAHKSTKGEMNVARSELAKDSARYLASFFELVSNHPLQNPLSGEE